MKFLGFLSGLVTILIAGIFVLVFTGFGNTILKPIIEKKIQTLTDTQAKLNSFSLTTNNFNIILDLDNSNSIYANGNFSLISQEFNIAYKVKLDRLQNLQKFTKNEKLKGIFHTTGSIVGDIKFINIDGTSNVASSDTSYHIELTKFNPTSIVAKIKKANLKEILSLIGEKKYADALIDIDMNISNAKIGELDGVVVSKLNKGILNSNFITSKYKFKSPMPKTLFNVTTVSKLNKNLIDTKINFNSNLASIDIKKITFNIDDNSIKSDYVLDISKLENLFFITQKHILGGLKINGEVKKGKDLDFTAHTDVAGGRVDLKLHNNDIKLSSQSIKTIKLLHKLIYPEIFDASLNAKVNYNLISSKGTMNGNLVNGKFTNNQVFDLVKEYARLDMYRENFNGTIKADIAKEHILASVDLTSRTSYIKAKDVKLNTKTNQIDSSVEINANGNPLTVALSGEITKPRVSIDANELIKTKTANTLTKEIQKKVGDKLGVDVGSILKGLF